MKSILFSVGLALCCVHVIAEEVIVWDAKGIPPVKEQQEIPIYVDINDSLLGLHFLDKVDQVTITVVGVEGIVYQKEVTTPFLNLHWRVTLKDIWISLQNRNFQQLRKML